MPPASGAWFAAWILVWLITAFLPPGPSLPVPLGCTEAVTRAWGILGR
jgi:hypothetical protein